MKTALLDVNVLIALLWPAHEHFDAAHDWFGARAGGARWATCPLTELAFVRIVSNPSFSPDALAPADALTLAPAQPGSPGPRVLAGRRGLPDAVGPLVPRLQGHRQLSDAYLLGLALEHRGTLASFDGGLRALASGSGAPAWSSFRLPRRPAAGAEAVRVWRPRATGGRGRPGTAATTSPSAGRRPHAAAAWPVTHGSVMPPARAIVKRMPKTVPEWAGKREPATPRTAGKMPAAWRPAPPPSPPPAAAARPSREAPSPTAEAAALAITRRLPPRGERPRPSHARVSMSAAQKPARA